MSKQRLIVRVKNAFGLNKKQRNEMQTELQAWYDSGADVLALSSNCEVAVLDGVWEHLVCYPVDFRAMEDAITAHEPDGWQVASVTSLPDCMCLVLKRRVLRADDE